MQNKKLLSTLLVLVMICACAFGMLVTNAGAEMTAETVEWDTDLATTIASIDGSAFDGTKYAEITIPAGEETAASAENGVLFGVETIFDANGARLPIVIKGEDTTATITFDEVSGDVSCSNSYTFQGLNFYVADAASQINFYAGSGEVVLDTVVLSEDGTGKNAYFYADNAAAAAFAGWTAPAEGELIATSLTFKNTDYTQAEWANGGTTANGANCKGQVGIVGAAADFANAEVTPITASMTSATLTIEDSKLSGVWLRKTTAASPVSEVNFVMNDSSDDNSNTTLNGIIGVGVSSLNDGGANKAGPWDLGNFDYNVTINGGTVSGRVVFFRGAIFTGDMNVTINGGKFGNEVYVAYGDSLKTGVIFGKITATINDGNFTSNFFGSNAAASCFNEDTTITEVDKIDNVTYIKGGTIKTFQGNRVSGSVHTVVTGGTITSYHGSYSTASGGGVYDMVVNTIDGGTITTFYGSGFNKHLDSEKPGVAGYSIPQLINNFNGGTITTAYGAGTPKFVENLTNNFNGTAFTSVYGTYFADYTDKGYEGFGGTRVTGTLTNNVNTAAGWVNGTSKVDSFRPIGYSIEGDLVLNLNCSQKKFAGFAPNAIPAAEITVKNFTLNATGVSGWGGETFLNDLRSLEDTTFNFTNCANNSHLVALYGGKVDGDLNVNVDTLNFTSSTKHRFFLIYDPLDAAVTSTKDMIGGDINLVMKGLTNKTTKGANLEAQRLVIAGRRASGAMASYLTIENDVNLTFEDTTLLTWEGNSSEINGTYTVTYKGTNVFANDAFPSNAARVNKQVNNIAGTITSDFYGAGAPVGTWVEVPATEEGAEPTLEFVPGEIENNILPGAAIKAVFFGSGEEEVKSVTNTMTGGSISSASGADANVELSLGCYYGNFGPVSDKVVNNIYSGSIGNNFYASNGDLECEIYTNMGNNLYAELYPEAEALAEPTFGRLTFAGGRHYTTETVAVDADSDGVQDTDAEGNPVTETVKNYDFDAKTGNTGPVYVNVDGATFGMVNWIYGGLHIADEEGFVGKFDVKNAEFTTFTYFNINPETESIEGNVSISLDGVTQPAKKGWFGPSKMTGDLTWNIKNSEFKSFVYLAIGDFYGNINVDMDNVIYHEDFSYTANWAAGSQSEYYANENNERPSTVYELSLNANVKNTHFTDFRDIGGSASTTKGVTGSLTERYENCIFDGSTTQVVNRDTRGECLFAFDSCTFKSTFTNGMRPNGGNVVYIYGDTVIGTPATETAEAVGETVYGVRYDTLTHVGAKPDAEGNPVAAETTLTMYGDSKLIAIRDASETNAAYGLKFYDVTVTGTGLIAPNLDADDATEGWQQGTTKPTVTLAGNLNVGETSPEIYANKSVNGTVSAVDGNWIVDKVYVTMLDADEINNVSGRSIGIANGYAKKVDNTLVGAAFIGGGAVSLDVGERIFVKLWIVKDDVDAYLAAGMKNTAGKNAFEYWGSIDLDPATEGNDKYLGEGVIDASNIADIEVSEDGVYYKVNLGAVAANNFDKNIELAGSTFALNTLGEDTPITILNVAAAGAESAADGTDDDNLFKAIYNYGASVLGVEMIAMEGFVQTGAAAPVYQKGSAEDIQFTSMSLLMGDAIGIRFKGNVIDAATVVTMTVNGEEVTCFNYDAEAGTVDAYVNMESVNDELTFIIYTDGAPAIAVKTSIKGYTEAVMNNGAAELAVAQLAQACANILA